MNRQEETLDLIKEFEYFWKQKYGVFQVRNPSRFYNELKKKIGECGSIAAITDYVKGMKTSKETTRKVIAAFFGYLREKGFIIDSDLETIRFYNYPFERQLEIAKFLYTKRTSR